MAKYPWGIYDIRINKVVRWCYTQKQADKIVKELNAEEGPYYRGTYN